MLNRAFKLTSTWKLFHLECERIKETFFRLRYPRELVESIIRRFIDVKVSEASRAQAAEECAASIRIKSNQNQNEIRVKEDKPPLVNQQCVVYSFKIDLCDAGYVGYTCRHLHQRIEEHKGSVIGDHLRNKHGIKPDNITRSFNILRKYKNKLDCLIFEMLFIKELKPTLNKQCDSTREKLFV